MNESTTDQEALGQVVGIERRELDELLAKGRCHDESVEQACVVDAAEVACEDARLELKGCRENLEAAQAALKAKVKSLKADRRKLPLFDQPPPAEDDGQPAAADADAETAESIDGTLERAAQEAVDQFNQEGGHPGVTAEVVLPESKAPRGDWRLRNLSTILTNPRHVELLADSDDEVTTAGGLQDLMDAFGETWNHGFRGIGPAAKKKIEAEFNAKEQ